MFASTVARLVFGKLMVISSPHATSEPNIEGFNN